MERHKKARQNLAINSLLFAGLSIFFVINFITNLIQSWNSTWGKITTLGSVVIYLAVAIPAILQAWKAFSDLDYGKSMSKGILAWAVPASLIVLDFIL
ncbi:MAG: hypothetical protein RMJ97_09750 [Raineya sp.]|nr:hypothetical protein [Raineya sp.]MDW8297149.1 hypothetical protein [Raineya sp.]